jgi:hypothetical protein
MAGLGNIQINVSDHFVELQALMCERDGMSAENQYRSHAGYSPAYVSDDFNLIAEKMRALKIVEGVQTQPTTAHSLRADNAGGLSD